MITAANAERILNNNTLKTSICKSAVGGKFSEREIAQELRRTAALRGIHMTAREAYNLVDDILAEEVSRQFNCYI